jgi:hypothetical protein
MKWGRLLIQNTLSIFKTMSKEGGDDYFWTGERAGWRRNREGSGLETIFAWGLCSHPTNASITSSNSQLLTGGCPATHIARAGGVSLSPGNNSFQGRWSSLVSGLELYRRQWGIENEFWLQCGRPGSQIFQAKISYIVYGKSPVLDWILDLTSSGVSRASPQDACGPFEVPVGSVMIRRWALGEGCAAHWFKR